MQLGFARGIFEDEDGEAQKEPVDFIFIGEDTRVVRDSVSAVTHQLHMH